TRGFNYTCRYALSIIPVFFFFFQAEDGIRDGHVTGVQTCALPIYLGLIATTKTLDVSLDLQDFVSIQRHAGGLQGEGQLSLKDRSEERRVGKECRSRWSPYH